MRLDETGLDEYTDRFDSYALRHEVLTRYDVASDDDGFARYLAGEPRPDRFAAGWHTWITAQKSAGREIRRVRVLYEAPSPYLCFECEWAYTGNVEAGEQIRILDLTERPRPSALMDVEFWLMDGKRAAVMTYDEIGAFQYATVVEGATVERYVASAAAAWDAGEPFTEWWDSHPQWHRGVWLAEHV